jgi:hypothetical protein
LNETQKETGAIVEHVPNKTIQGVEDINIDPEAEKKLLRKIDWHLLPMIWVIYLLSYMVGYLPVEGTHPAS